MRGSDIALTRINRRPGRMQPTAVGNRADRSPIAVPPKGGCVVGDGHFQRTIQDQIGIAAVVRGLDDRALVAGANADGDHLARLHRSAFRETIRSVLS